MPTQADLFAVAPELILIAGAGVLLLIDAFAPKLRQISSELTLLTAAGAAWALLALPHPGAAWSGMMRSDTLSVLVSLCLLVAVFLCSWMAGPYLRRANKETGEFYALLIFATTGAMFMASSIDLLPLFLGLELLSVALYVLNAFFKDVDVSLEAGLKYFIVGAFAAAFTAYGIALLYGATGTTNIEVMGRTLGGGAAVSPVLIAGFAMVAGGMAFKLALFPFHAWAPDVYQGSPTPVTAFLSVVPKAAALIVLLRFAIAFDLLHMGHSWVWAAGIVAVGSQTLGNIVAIVQRDIKRMLAYSGIAHMGYAMVGVIVAGTAGSSAVLVYIAAYTVMNIGAFAVISLMSENEAEPHLITDLAGQGWSRPLAALALSISMFSLAGVPPFAGFAAKFFIFRSAVNQGLIWLAVLGVINSLISAFYYLRVVYILYMKPLPRRVPDFLRSRAIGAVAGVSAALVVLIGLYPTWVFSAARTAAKLLVR